MHSTMIRIDHMNRCKDLVREGRRTAPGRKDRTRKAGDFAVIERGSFAELLARTRAHWDCARGGAIDDFLRAVFPDRLEGFEL